MLKFVNNYIEPIVLSISQTSAALNLPDGEYRLTIADSKSAATRWEIIGAIVTSGSAVLQRGLEDSSAQAWPAGSVIYNALTAGVLNEIMGALAPQSDVPVSEFLSFRRNADGSLTVSTKPSAVAGTAYDVGGVTYYVAVDSDDLKRVLAEGGGTAITGSEPIEFTSPSTEPVSCLVGNIVTSNVTNMDELFAEYSNLDCPLSFDTSAVDSMSQMFFDATVFNHPVNFDTSLVTVIQYMFYGAKAFNQPVNFDTSSVMDMGNMFHGATAFNQPLEFNTSNVISFEGFLVSASSFNQPINFDTRAVITMPYMFYGATSFNQPLDFDLPNAINMEAMFQTATSFNQDLSGWCVPLITAEPIDFSTGASAWSLPKPIWGACPG